MVLNYSEPHIALRQNTVCRVFQQRYVVVDMRNAIIVFSKVAHEGVREAGDASDGR